MKSSPIRGGLPIDAVIPALLEALEASPSAVLQAPPGAGKSTVVPLVLLEAGWARGKRIMMLEPRRLAARAVAQRMAQTLGQSVGRTVGYRMRMDTRVSGETRIEVVTEGVLTRILQHDPGLEDFAAVIFDEFHERSLQADLGLALTLDARESLSSDLRILVMSATLDGEAVAKMLGGAPVISAAGRLFPVESRYAGRGMPLLPGVGTRAASGAVETPEKLVTQIILRALREESGDILVFLPGAREIRRVQSLLQSGELAESVRVWPLFGELSGEEQDAALLPAPAGIRKVVLATNIAETSLTIEGVRVVVDSGLVRRSVFDASTGMSRLETQRISRASAEQRQGRAGRLGPGVAYRAWSEGSQRSLAPFSPAEIVDADLVPLALELARWGARDAGSLRWLDAPPAATLASARDLLARLGALDADGRITAHGREMGDLGVHPRLSHMLLRARQIGCLPLAGELAALLSDRDVLRGSSGSRDADVRTRIDVLRGTSEVAQVDRYGLQRARSAARDLVRQVGESRGGAATAGTRAGEAATGLGGEVAPAVRESSGASAVESRGGAVGYASAAGRSGGDAAGHESAAGRSRGDAVGRASGAGPTRGRREIDYTGVLLAFAYPDRIGRRRSGSHGAYTLANGRGAHFDEAQPLAKHELIVAVDLDDTDRDARILLAAPIDREDLEDYLPERLQRSESIEWSSREQAVIARRVVKLDEIVLEEKPLPSVPADAARAAMLQGVRELGLAALPWTRDARDLQARIEFAGRYARRGGSSRDASGGDASGGDASGGDAGNAVDDSGRHPAADTRWPEVSDAVLTLSIDEWLAPWLDGITRREHLARLSMVDILRGLLSWEQQRELERLAPSHLQVPSGSNIRIDYLDESAPVVSVRLQEVFGLQETPRVGNGQVPVTFKLLSPAQRPVQVTRDLAGFWRGSYADVRKDMRGRYPKHYWPENPLDAEPTRGVRRRPQ